MGSLASTLISVDRRCETTVDKVNRGPYLVIYALASVDSLWNSLMSFPLVSRIAGSSLALSHADKSLAKSWFPIGMLNPIYNSPWFWDISSGE